MNTPESISEGMRKTWRNDQLMDMVSTLVRPRVGTRSLWAPPENIIPKRDLLSLGIGIPDSGSLPREKLNEAMRYVMDQEDDISLRYGFGPGYLPLREYLAEKYTSQKGLEVTADWFFLTNGSAGAIDQIVRSLINPGDVIITEAPTYMGTLANFTAVGAEICPVTMDESGLIISELKAKIRALKEKGKQIKLLYTISSFQNPTSVTMTTERKLELLDIALQEKFLILDDDAYGDLYFDAPPSEAMSTLSGGYGVLTVGSFSKVLATGLRLGWAHAHPETMKLFSHMRFNMGLNQMAVHMVARFLKQGHLPPHMEKVRALYKKKMTLTADLLDEHLSDFVSFTRPAGGFYLWVKLKKGLTTRQVWRTATQEGVAVNPGYTSIPAGSEVEGEFFRIAYSWTPMEQLEEAVRRLAIACQRVADGDPA
jgi:2-aminoadipate transaminase